MPRLLDLFCGAGGASAGYQRAGFHVTGVDLYASPRYCGEAFACADALDYLERHGAEFDAIHASPPCQRFTQAQTQWKREHADLLSPVRELLLELGTPFVIENVVGAPLRSPLMLCGSMFGLGLAGGRGYLQRHRLFEASGHWLSPMTPPCNHPAGVRAVGVHGHTGGRATRSGQVMWSAADWREAMGIDWMSRDELAQAIPPAYTEFLGRQLMAYLEGEHTPCVA